MKIDRMSLLADVSGDERLDAIEAELALAKLTLGMKEVPSQTIAQWIAEGARGSRDPWNDPVDHLVAGFSAVMRNGREVVIPPSPRRSVGPDLFGLFLGQNERAGKITRLHLRVFVLDAAPVVASPTGIVRNPPVTDAEQRLFDRVFAELEKNL